MLSSFSPVAQATDTPSTATRNKIKAAARQTEPTYFVNAGLDGEIYPAFANFASLRPARLREWGVVSVKISNLSDKPLRERVAVQVPGWSDEEIQVAELGAGEIRTLMFAPTFYPRLYRNREIVAATVSVKITDFSGKVAHASTAPVRLRSADDIYWGRDFKYANYIASWIMPHDPEVELVLKKAKEFMPGRRLPGYESNKNAAAQEKFTILQAKAIYKALQRAGVSYVKSSTTFGGNQDWSERVRTPGESLQRASANCIDGVVMYASLFENLGMDPVVVIIPGHAYVGVRVARGSSKYLFIETALTGRATFENAVASAERGLQTALEKDVIRIHVDQARDRGIYPMPTAASLGDVEGSAQQLGSR